MLLAKALLTGSAAGLVVSLFRLLIERSLTIWQYIYRIAAVHLSLLWLIIPASAGIGLVIGLLIRHEPNAMGSGIPQVEGQLAGELETAWQRILPRKFIGGVLGIGAGLFLGREGPSIQLGSAVGQGIAEHSGTERTQRRILIAGGAAAGLSAAFNAPIAGTLFVLEEIYHNFSPLIWMSALTAAIASDFISSDVFGLQPVLHMHVAGSLPLILYWHLLAVGLILGLLGYFYQRTLLVMPLLYSKIPRISRAFHGIIPLLLVIPVGLFCPQLLGGGNALIIHLSHASPGLLLLIGIFALRFVFSMICYGSGLPGGIFLPILSLGATIGAIYGAAMSALGLLPATYETNLIIVAMAGYFAGISKAPFTAIILITEMVGSLEHLLPLAIVSLVAYLVVDALGGAPIYQSLLEQSTIGSKLNVLSGKMIDSSAK